jgi:hypothetical protein
MDLRARTPRKTWFTGVAIYGFTCAFDLGLILLAFSSTIQWVSYAEAALGLLPPLVGIAVIYELVIPATFSTIGRIVRAIAAFVVISVVAYALGAVTTVGYGLFVQSGGGLYRDGVYMLGTITEVVAYGLGLAWLVHHYQAGRDVPMVVDVPKVMPDSTGQPKSETSAK